MAILEKEVWITLGGNNDKYFESLGYEIPRKLHPSGKLHVPKGTKLKVKTRHLKKHSGIKITKVCDYCEQKIYNVPYYEMMRQRRKSVIDLCRKCSDDKNKNKKKDSKKKKNCLAYTHPEIAKLVLNKELSYQLTHGSGKKVDFVCGCGKIIKDKTVHTVVRRGLSCPECSDGISYPEKFMFNLLDQLDIDFESQKIFNWSENKRYDFYIPKYDCIIETHGLQHYKHTGFDRTLEEEQRNDDLKEKLAKENGIENYIVIDCRKSEMEWIKNKVLDSKLKAFF